ncbi:MAG: chemotaxis protein CheW [Coprothermobacterota bacterium]|nr:chemotaxis protein CheW [Coprothermobacterota bacterium]
MPPSDPQETLRLRAQALRQKPAPVEQEGESLQALTFRLADELYGLETVHVREVVPLRSLVPVPCTPPFVLGLINLRGQILSVVDLRRIFGIPAGTIEGNNPVIVVQREGIEFGLLAESVLGIRSLRLETLQADLPTLGGVGAEFLRGVTAEGLILLDGLKLIGSAHLLVQEEVL